MRSSEQDRNYLVNLSITKENNALNSSLHLSEVQILYPS